MQQKKTAVCFDGVARHFGEVRAVNNVSFEIGDGEFFSMLGPSGSGKTTCLRLIAGFEQPDAGHIAVHGVNVDGVPPYERDVNTVFQDYALFPHMTVSENVEYGLMIRKVAPGERRRHSREMLALVKLEAPLEARAGVDERIVAPAQADPVADSPGVRRPARLRLGIDPQPLVAEQLRAHRVARLAQREGEVVAHPGVGGGARALVEVVPGHRAVHREVEPARIAEVLEPGRGRRPLRPP